MFRTLLIAVLCLSAFILPAQNHHLQFRSKLSFPGQTLANICGYWQDGREYALVGGSKGLIIIDITDPAQPVTIVQIPGPDDLWKEIKVYQHYAYVTSEGGSGVQIVDLKSLPAATLPNHYYQGTGAISGTLNRIHALHIDVSKGYLYTYGSQDSGPNGTNGALVHDLNADPYNPTYVGQFNQLGYIHDGYVDNDTLYACHINSGQMSVVDMRVKTAPKLLGAVETPAKFTHNSWMLGDRKTMLTTDERVPSFLTAYDVSDPADIRELDRIATTPTGTTSIGHNTHILNDWAITSWYSDGFTIVDAHRPQNLIEVGRYDTWATPLAGDYFVGCWGVFPFFPSGTIVASNIEPAEFFVLTPDYVRAAYLEGRITNGCNNQPLVGASIQIDGASPNSLATSNATGLYKTGLAETGNFSVTISKSGFKPQTLPISLSAGQVTELNVTLEADGLFNAILQVVDGLTQQPLINRSISLTGINQDFELQTNAQGQISLNCIQADTYNAGIWGYLTGKIAVTAAGTYTLALQPGYSDAFGADLGWTAESTASAGYWELGEPIGTNLQGNAANPDNDVTTDDNDQCYVTGNAGGQAGTDDVDGGEVTLTSPPMLLSVYQDAVLTFSYWFVNGGGSGSPNDRFEARVLNGGTSVTVLTQGVSASQWRNSGDIHLKDYFPAGLTDDVRVQFWTADLNPGHVVEAAVDAFKLVPQAPSSVSPDLLAAARLVASPNPSLSAFSLRYDWPAADLPLLEVRDVLGRVLESRVLSNTSGSVDCGQAWPKGMYFAMLRSTSQHSATLKLVKE